MAVFLFTSLAFKNDFNVEILPSLTSAVLGWGPHKSVYYLWRISSKNGELPCICHIPTALAKWNQNSDNFTLDQIHLLTKVLRAVLVNACIPLTKILQMLSFFLFFFSLCMILPKEFLPSSSMGLCAGTAIYTSLCFSQGQGSRLLLERYHEVLKVVSLPCDLFFLL